MAGTSIAIRWQGSQHTSSQDAPLATEENDSAQGNSIKFNDANILALMSPEASAKDVCERLVVEALANGGRDNITVVVARVNES